MAGRVIPKTQKMVRDAFLLKTFLRYGSRVNGEIQVKKKRLPFLLLVANEKGALGSSSTVGQLNLLLIVMLFKYTNHILIYIHLCSFK